MTGTPAAKEVIIITPPRPTEAIITLQTLRCVEHNVSNPIDTYIWPALVQIDKKTLAVSVVTPPVDQARAIIRYNMIQGEIAEIPIAVGVLKQLLADGPSESALILAVTLWDQVESSDTPWDAVQAGCEAYASSLQQAIGANLTLLGSADPNSQQQGITNVKTAVSNSVQEAIKDKLTWLQKAEVWLGELAIDSVIDDSSTVFSGSTLASKSFTVSLGGSANLYEIAATLNLVPQEVQIRGTAVAS